VYSRIRAGGLALATLLGAVVVGAAPAGAEGNHYANYKGTTIDLAEDWQGAQACAIVTDDDIECFDSQAELESALAFGDGEGSGDNEAAAAAASSTSSLTTLSTYCIGRSDLWLTLYDDTGFGGRSLNFRDAAVWQNLSTYTFDNAMGSWANNTFCDALAAWDASGGGSWLTMTARSSNSNVGATWNNQASSIYIYSS
jgi:hypothetical protein